MTTEGYFLTVNGSADKAFELRSFELDSLTLGQVTIETEAFGLNFADVVARRGLYRDAPPMPCVLGYEVVGRIIDVADGGDHSLVGTRVLAFCRFGGYAKHVITTEDACVVVEQEPAEELLALSTQGVTAYYMASYLTPVRQDYIVLIHAAAGGVGSILIQLAKLAGAEVIAKVGRSEKEPFVRNIGADHVVNYNESDYIEQVKAKLSGRKLDVSYNPVAGSTYKKDLSVMGAGARMILFGGSELGEAKFGIFSKLNFVRKMGVLIPVGLMMNSRSILGVNMLKIADEKPMVLKACLHAIVELYQKGKLKTFVGGKYVHTELANAHSFLESGRSTGKIAVFWNA
jgi:NADPH2:quinone reductase